MGDIIRDAASILRDSSGRHILGNGRCSVSQARPTRDWPTIARGLVWSDARR